ncbi:Uncharacterised protein [Mycobacteroides abscessus subsp. abscessus]|nr:Uncharacterised protein [Mycobacteroides abscessus subsp. abscessus]
MHVGDEQTGGRDLGAKNVTQEGHSRLFQDRHHRRVVNVLVHVDIGPADRYRRDIAGLLRTHLCRAVFAHAHPTIMQDR